MICISVDILKVFLEKNPFKIFMRNMLIFLMLIVLQETKKYKKSRVVE